MPVSIGQSISVSTTLPIDVRFVVDTTTDLTTYFSSGILYEGLTVYVKDVNTIYALVNPAAYTTLPSAPGSGWVPLVDAGGGISTVNGNSGTAGNITVGLVSTYVGLSASADYSSGGIGSNYNVYPAMSGSYPFWRQPNGSPGTVPATGSMWIVYGETLTPRTGSNGQVFLFISSSTVTGQWASVTAYSAAALNANAQTITVGNAINADSASAVLGNSAQGLTTGVYALPLFKSDSINHFTTLRVTESVAYDFATNTITATAAAATGLQQGNGTIVSADNIPYVNGAGTLIVPDGAGGTPNQLPFDQIGQIDYYTNTTTATDTTTLPLSSLQVLDYTAGGPVDSFSVTFAGGKLTLQFGTPINPEITLFNTTNSGGTETWTTNRFNLENTSYYLKSTWTTGANTLTTASLWVETNTGAWYKLNEVYAGTSMLYQVTNTPYTNVYGTTGSSNPSSNSQILAQNSYGVGKQKFKLELTSSNQDNVIEYTTPTIITRSLDKSLPGNPSHTLSYTSAVNSNWTSFLNTSVGYSATNLFIEYGDSGTITQVPSAPGSEYGWNPNPTSYLGTNGNLICAPDPDGTYALTNTAGIASPIVFQTTASYNSGVLNTPTVTYKTYATNINVNRRRSVRYGRTSTSITSLTSGNLLDAANWSSTTGGTGTAIVDQGTLYWNETDNPHNKILTMDVASGTAPFYEWIVISSNYTLSAIRNTLGADILASEYTNLGLVGTYWRVYRSTIARNVIATGDATTFYNKLEV